MFLVSTLAFSECLNGEMTSAQAFMLFNRSHISSVELGLCNKGEFNIHMSLETMRTIKNNARQNGIALKSVSTTCLNKANYEYDEFGRCEAFDMVKKMIDIASYLEIPNISFHGRRMPEKNMFNAVNYHELELDFLNSVANYASEKGVICCLENRIDGWAKTVKDYIHLAAQVDHKYLKLCYDTGNGIFSSSPEEWINDANQKYIQLIHFSDVRIKTLRGVLLEFVKPGTGILDFFYIYRLIENAHFTCDIVIEHFFNKSTEVIDELKELLNKFIKRQEV